MEHLTLLVKPASSLCDLRCRYCFYEDVSDSRQVKNMGRMTEETARRLLTASVQAVGAQGSMQITFQGGEPTLAGLEFYRSFLALEGQICPSSLRITHSIQTNGMTLDREWADFLGEHGFLVGLSLDGAREFHDTLRVDPRGKGTWDRAVRALALLDGAGVETNLLCVVTNQLSRSPQKVYQSLKKLGNHPLQFIPCLDPLDAPRGGMPYSLRPATGSSSADCSTPGTGIWRRGGTSASGCLTTTCAFWPGCPPAPVPPPGPAAATWWWRGTAVCIPVISLCWTSGTWAAFT